MNMLAAAGIYVISDLSEPSESINRDSPAWNGDLYERYTAVVDMFSKYTNVIGFFAGNEVSNLPNNTEASAFVKAAVRDTKAYIKTQNYPNLYVGYATYDGPIQLELAEYFNCGDAASAIDFWGWNVYSWCGSSTYAASGYQSETAFFSTYSVPVFFAEYGCNTQEPRTFQEVGTLYGTQMTPVWSGGIVYMYFQEANNFGKLQYFTCLVKHADMFPPGLVSVISNTTVSTRADYSYLSVALATISPSSTVMSAYTTSNTATSCPTTGASWAAVASPLPPTPNAQLCQCMVNELTCAAVAGLAVTNYQSNFDYICAANPANCVGIQANASTGKYGAYSVCNSTQQLSFVMNQYYFDQPAAGRASACNFGGNATTKTAAAASGTCSALIAQAGTNGNGTVATPTGNSTSGSQATSSSAGKTSKAGANGLSVLHTGNMQLGVYVLGAVLTGVGMILL